MNPKNAAALAARCTLPYSIAVYQLRGDDTFRWYMFFHTWATVCFSNPRQARAYARLGLAGLERRRRRVLAMIHRLQKD